MSALFYVFKTLFTPEINIQKLGFNEYIKRAPPTAFAWCVGSDGEPDCELAPFSNELLENVQVAARESWVAISHNSDFHSAVWKNLGWPGKPDVNGNAGIIFGCSMKAAKTKLPELKSFTLAKLALHYGLPPRLDYDEKDPNLSPDALRALAIRDVSLCRAISCLTMGEIAPAVV